MANLLRSIFSFLNRDLSGQSWEEIRTHPFFGELVYFGFKDPSQSYWEGELPLPGESTKFSVTMQGTTEGPTSEEEAFCRRVLSDPDALFEKCRKAFEPVFREWTRQPIPSGDWRSNFQLDGVEVPPGGAGNSRWQATYFVVAAGQYFTANFENGYVSQVLVNG
jgi:hypothetical protein